MKNTIPALKGWLAIAIAFIISAGVKAQDTLQLSLPGAENLFLQKIFYC